MIQYLSAPETPELGTMSNDINSLFGPMMTVAGGLMGLFAIVLIVKAVADPYRESSVVAPAILLLLAAAMPFIGSLAPSPSESPQNDPASPEPTPDAPAPQPEPIDWNAILPIAAIVIGVIIVIIVAVIAVMLLRKNSDTRRLKKEQRQREKPIIRISDLRGRMEAHHNGSYTEVMVHKANEFMLTAPAFFDTSLPEAIAYEQAKREAAEALEGWDSDTAAPAEQIALVDKVFTAWSDFKERAYKIGLNGLTQRDVDLLHKYTQALSHGGLNTNEYELYLKNLIKLYDKIQYGDSDGPEPPVKRRGFLNRPIKQRLSGRAITSHAQFTRALTPSGGHMRAIEK